MRVAGAAALLVGLSDALLVSFGSNPNSQVIRSDPVRVIEAVIAGISFLSAGTIFRDRRSHMTGLTTAASLLFSGGIGVAVALRQWTIAIGATLLVLLVLRALNRVENRLNKENHAGGDRLKDR